ncbi:MAG: dCTP deaminase, partial [Gammaproteobacteria bacterium]|nr:dCTP deaminase [Gammaproteobacteria bacterium]
MTIKSDKWIKEMSEKHEMINPFEAGQIRVDQNNQKLISYGTSSYGY